jgi:hypothetical protein
MRSRATHPAAVTAGAVVVAFGLVGLAHAPFARSLLMSVGGCPVAGARMTPGLAERARQLALAGDRPGITAPWRPALGFALGSTTIPEARRWARRERVDCGETRPGLMTCAGVAPEALGAGPTQGKIDELTLAFDPQGRLVNMTTLRAHLTPLLAATEARAIVASLAERLGPAQRRGGDFEVSSLGATPARSISTVAYRFDDYVADVTAMNAPSSGPSIREHYMSARD